MCLNKKELAELKRDLKSKYTAKQSTKEEPPKKVSAVNENEWDTDSEEEIVEAKPKSTKPANVKQPIIVDDGN